jgi:hypothetical protein
MSSTVEVPHADVLGVSWLLPHATLHIYHSGHVEFVTATEQVPPLTTTFLTSHHQEVSS